MISPRAEVIDRTSSAVTMSGDWFVNGKYEGCKGHLDHTSWSLAINSNAPPQSAPKLAVAKGDADCHLTVTGLERRVDMTTTQFGVDAGTFPLEPGYQAAPQSFGESEFLGNAKLGSLDWYAGPFTISLLLSDVRESDSEEHSASFASYAASAEGSTVAAPNYQVSMVTFKVGTDSTNKVVSPGDITGTLDLIAPEDSAPGEGWAVSSGPFSGPPTYAEVGGEYSDLGESNLSILGRGPMQSNGPTSIPASSFGLLGQNLTNGVDRWVIISHVDQESNVPSYQIIRVTFKAPPSPQP